MKTTIMKSNGVRDSTEEKVTQNWAAAYAKELAEAEKKDREAADNALNTKLDGHVNEHATETKQSHVKLSDSVIDTSNADGATAATPYAVKRAYDKAQEGIDRAEEIQSNLDTETSSRQTDDNTLNSKITNEKTERESADNALDSKITNEKTVRESADNALSGRIATLESKAHMHANKSVLDGISAADIAVWNGIKEQVTQAELDKVKAYFEEMCFGFSEEFNRVYSALEITVYDGGIFGMEQREISLDGSDFDDEITGIVDCGGFEQITIGVGTNVDGGIY